VRSAIGNLPNVNAMVPATNNLSGEIYGSTQAALSSNLHLHNAVQTRMGNLRAERLDPSGGQMLAANGASGLAGSSLYDPAQRLWVNTWVFDGHTDGNRNAARAEHSGSGVALGTDVRVNPSLTLGVLFGYEDGKVKNGDSRSSRTDIEGYSLGGYFSADAAGLDVRGGLVYSHLDLKSRRDIQLPGLSGRVKADYNGYRVQAFGEVGKAFSLTDDLLLSPYFNLTQSWLHTDKAKERGNAAALTVSAKSDSVTQTTVGVRPQYRLPTETPVAVNLNLGWAHAFGDTDSKTTNRFGDTGNSFSVQGSKVDKNRAVVGAGLEAQISPNASFGFGYDGQFGSDYKNHTGTLEFKVRF